MVEGNKLLATPRMRALLLSLVTALSAAGAWAVGPAAPMHIGAILPDSWPDKQQGEDIRNGMLLALKTWPGNPAPTLEFKDSACDVRKAGVAAQALLDSKVDVVVGAFCVLGTVPALTRAAGVPFISANAERLATLADSSLQLGVVPVNMADGIATKLRVDTGLRVTASSACWIDFEPKLSAKYDAAVCPTLHIDMARWNDIAPTYSAAYRRPFSLSAARGYAAMQVALAVTKQLRAGSKPASVLKDLKEVPTLLGTVRYHDESAPPADAMQLLLAAKLPRVSPRETSALDEVLKSKACACSKSGSCPSSASWSSQPFVLQSCASGPTLAQH